ncbi:hypothetical protein NMG60_11033773 [Bertholletia excelsa]
MAATTAQVLQNHETGTSEISRQEIQAAIAKAVELRALHAALVQSNNSPATLRFTTSSPVPHHIPQLSAQDYPVFTPSYEDETLPGYQQMHLGSRTMSECWDDNVLGEANLDDTTLSLSDYKKANSSSRKGYPSELLNLEPHICPAEDQQSPGPTDFYRSSRRNSLGDFKSLSSCNKCKPAIISRDDNSVIKNNRHSNVVVPLTDSHSSFRLQPKNNHKSGLSWLFPKLRKKHRNENMQTQSQSQVFKELEIMSIEALKRELMEANESRDVALMEASEMKSSLGELKQKLEYLESYCEELKKALRQAIQTKDTHMPPGIGKSTDGIGENVAPLSEEAIVEGFLQVVSEARSSVKHFCKTLLGQIEETDDSLMENLNLLLRPYKLSFSSKYSKAVLYHLEAIVNQSLYQDFENSVFQKNGAPKFLDPEQDRQAQFSSFVALRNLSWNEVLRKGTRYYSEEFSKFCDQKMSGIIITLNWTRPWPEQLLQSFFVAAKCIWLLHLLAFSFTPPLGILRVEDNRSFDQRYMEDVIVDRQKSHGPSRVKIMVMPGFYLQDKVLRCKVLCRYKPVA